MHYSLTKSRSCGVKAARQSAYFRKLTGRMDPKHWAHADPLAIAAEDMLQASELYEQRLADIGRKPGVDDPWQVAKLQCDS